MRLAPLDWSPRTNFAGGRACCGAPLRRDFLGGIGGRRFSPFVAHEQFDHWGHLLHRGHKFLELAHGGEHSFNAAHAINHRFEVGYVGNIEGKAAFGGCCNSLRGKDDWIYDFGRTGECISDAGILILPEARCPTVHRGRMLIIHEVTPFFVIGYDGIRLRAWTDARAQKHFTSLMREYGDA